MEEDSSKFGLCSACGKPPRETDDGKNKKPLKPCSRCKSAWYHDSTCQRKHYPIHKKSCREKTISKNNKAARSTTPTETTTKQQASPPNGPSFIVEQREKKGNCLISAVNFKKDERICNNDVGGGKAWLPLVPPVLHEEYRQHRCAYCFGILRETFFRFQDIPPKPQYLLLFCSPNCREEGQKVGIHQEELSISRMYSEQQTGGGPPRIFSTAILLYRILVAEQRLQQNSEEEESEAFTRKINKLQAKPAMTLSVEEDSANQHHTQAVVLTVMAMIQKSPPAFSLNLPQIQDLNDMVNRIKINGFSICDGEFKALGVGLYDLPSFMNHSCSPNVIQTYLYGQMSKLPTLLLTAYKDIPIGQEITISYIDNSTPIHIRQDKLLKDYFFVCDCERCKDSDHESRTVGLKCNDCGTDNKSKVEQVREEGPDLIRRYRCNACNKSDFHDQVQFLHNLETTWSNNSSSTNSSLDELRRVHNRLLEICHVDSWYVQESGDRVLQYYIDLIKSKNVLEDDDIHDAQIKVANEALQIIDPLLLDKGPTQQFLSSSSSASQFKRILVLCKVAKLRLFAQPDPRRAIEEIQICEEFLKSFYPSNHDLMIEVKEMKQNAMMC